jgi:hypothetical protein
VADGRDDRDRAGGDGAHDLLFVEGPQILDRAAAARDDHQIGLVRHPIEAAHGGRDLRRSPLPLHRHRPDDDMAGAAIRQAVKNVANDGAGRRSHHADPARQEGQPLLALGIEQAFGGKRPAALVEQGHQRPLPRQFQAIDDDLVFGPARIDGELARRHHFDAVLGAEAQHRRASLPDDRVDAGLVVLHREIAVARSVTLEAGDFAPQAHHAEGVLDRALQAARQLGDRHCRCVVAGGLGC